jgi:hypothetical protein
MLVIMPRLGRILRLLSCFRGIVSTGQVRPDMEEGISVSSQLQDWPGVLRRPWSRFVESRSLLGPGRKTHLGPPGTVALAAVAAGP